MKRTGLALALLLALSLGTLTAAHLLVNSARDQVEVVETVFSGDPAAAADLELTFRHRDQQGYLFWTTTFRPGEAPAAETAFRFSAEELEPDWSWADAPYVQLSIDVPYSVSGHFEPADLDGDFLFAMAADVAKRTPAGETRTETLLVEDYTQVYPLALSVNYDGRMGEYYTTITQEAFGRYFQYQVAPGQQLEVSVTLDGSGMMTNVTAGFSDQPYLQSQGVVTERGAYFLAQVWDSGGPTDLLRCAQGQGIHFLPLCKKGPSWFDPAGLRLLYPLDPSNVLYLGLTEDGGKLLLYTREADRLILTVIDAGTGAQLQRLDLLPMAPDEFLNETIDRGPLHLAALSGESGGFCLLEETPEGVISVLTGSLDQEDYHQSALTSRNQEAALLWDGGRLMWAVPGVDLEDYRLCLRLGVWDEAGLQFLAQYKFSPGRDPSAWQNPHQYPYDNPTPVSLDSLNFCEK